MLKSNMQLMIFYIQWEIMLKMTTEEEEEMIEIND